jgi:predicted alpha-1,6-mannanase (GH76 family)
MLDGQTLNTTIGLPFQEYVGTLRWSASTTFVQLPSNGPIGVLEGWKEYLSTRLHGSDMVKDDAIIIPTPTLIDGAHVISNSLQADH